MISATLIRPGLTEGAFDLVGPGGSVAALSAGLVAGEIYRNTSTNAISVVV